MLLLSNFNNLRAVASLWSVLQMVCLGAATNHGSSTLTKLRPERIGRSPCEQRWKISGIGSEY
jgi:hypothetical protein